MNEATLIIAAWNSAELLPKSIDCALNQSGVRSQVIVADDASTDDTEAVVAKYSDVLYTRLTQNGGPSAARNAAIELATTDWIAVLDSDDTIHSDRLRHMIDLAQRTQADIVLGNFQRVDEDGTLLREPHFLYGADIDPENALTLKAYIGQNIFDDVALQTGYLKPIFRKSTMDRMGLRYDEKLRNSEDFHIVLRAIALGAKVVISTDPEYFYTVRTGSISYHVDTEKLTALQQADAAFVEEFSSQMDEDARRLFARRCRSLIDVTEGERVMGFMKKRQFARVLGHLLRRPATVSRVAHQLMEALGKRLGRHI